MQKARNNLSINDFDRFANYLNIPFKAIDGKFLDQKETILSLITQYHYFSESEKINLTKIINDRFNRLIY